MAKKNFLIHSALSSAILTVWIFLTPPIFAQITSYSNKGVSLNLPEGWVAQEVPNLFEKEVVAWIQSKDIEGASILVYRFTGRKQNYSSVRIAGLKQIGASYPKGQEMLKKPAKIKTDVGLTAVWEYWRGAVESGGQTIFLESPMGIVETKTGWVLMIGFTPATPGPQLEQDFLTMMNSVK